MKLTPADAAGSSALSCSRSNRFAARTECLDVIFVVRALDIFDPADGLSASRSGSSGEGAHIKEVLPICESPTIPTFSTTLRTLRLALRCLLRRFTPETHLFFSSVAAFCPCALAPTFPPIADIVLMRRGGRQNCRKLMRRSLQIQDGNEGDWRTQGRDVGRSARARGPLGAQQVGRRCEPYLSSTAILRTPSHAARSRVSGVVA